MRRFIDHITDRHSRGIATNRHSSLDQLQQSLTRVNDLLGRVVQSGLPVEQDQGWLKLAPLLEVLLSYGLRPAGIRSTASSAVAETISQRLALPLMLPQNLGGTLALGTARFSQTMNLSAPCPHWTGRTAMRGCVQCL